VLPRGGRGGGGPDAGGPVCSRLRLVPAKRLSDASRSSLEPAWAAAAGDPAPSPGTEGRFTSPLAVRVGRCGGSVSHAGGSDSPGAGASKTELEGETGRWSDDRAAGSTGPHPGAGGATLEPGPMHAATRVLVVEQVDQAARRILGRAGDAPAALHRCRELLVEAGPHTVDRDGVEIHGGHGLASEEQVVGEHDPEAGPDGTRPRAPRRSKSFTPSNQTARCLVTTRTSGMHDADESVSSRVPPPAHRAYPTAQPARVVVCSILARPCQSPHRSSPRITGAERAARAVSSGFQSVSSST
jgi:hypothetical protein